MQEVSQQRFEESYGFAVLLCYSETNGLRACAFNGHAYLSPFRQLRQLQPCQFISQPQSGQKRVLFSRAEDKHSSPKSS